MISYNYQKLKGRIVEKFGTQQIFSKKMGWSTRTTSLKLTNQIYWKQNEISKAFCLLDIKPEEIPIYFFKCNVQ